MLANMYICFNLITVFNYLQHLEGSSLQIIQKYKVYNNIKQESHKYVEIDLEEKSNICMKWLTKKIQIGKLILVVWAPFCCVMNNYWVLFILFALSMIWNFESK